LQFSGSTTIELIAVRHAQVPTLLCNSCTARSIRKALLLLACHRIQTAKYTMANKRGKETENAIRAHIKSLGEGLDGIVEGYGPDAILLTENISHQGHDEIREYYQYFISDLLPLLADSYQLGRFDVIGEAGYLTWSALPSIPQGTDTILVHEGKIVLHTRTIYLIN